MTATIAYQSDRVTLYHGLAGDVLAQIPTESVDLVLTDPPYGVEWRSNVRAQRFDMLAGDGADDAQRADIRAVLADCVRVVGQGRHLYVFGPDDVLDGLKVSATASLVWDKAIMGAGDLSAPWGPAHEPITFAVSKHRHAGESGKSSVPVRMRKGSVLRFTRTTGRKVRHPSEKPVGLLRELVESSTRAGDMVLDPFAGIASTGVAAVLAGRRAILAEVDEQWIGPAVDRLRSAERLADEAAAI